MGPGLFVKGGLLPMYGSFLDHFINDRAWSRQRKVLGLPENIAAIRHQLSKESGVSLGRLSSRLVSSIVGIGMWSYSRMDTTSKLFIWWEGTPIKQGWALVCATTTS